MKIIKVEVWSDFACPFCYIGKRKFEYALQSFDQRDGVEMEFKSFQLNPGLQSGQFKDLFDYLSKTKNISVEEARSMNDYVKGVAQAVDLSFIPEKVVVANTFDAHKLSHLAKEFNMQSKVSMELFEAHFAKGRDLSDHTLLKEIGERAGIPSERIRSLWDDEQIRAAVIADQHEAAELGISGVPFFVFNRTYAVSGAQSPEVFLETLQQSAQL